MTLGNRTAGKAANFTLPIQDVTGAPIDGATAAAWELFDDRGTSITSGQVPSIGSNDTSIAITIDGGFTGIPDGASSAGRELVVTFSTTGGDVELRDYFVLTTGGQLAICQNTLMLMAEAAAVRTEFAQLPAWDAAGDDQRIAAMIESYHRLVRVGYQVTGYQVDNQSSLWYAAFGKGKDVPWGWWRRIRLGVLTSTQFDSLPAAFRNAVKRAQLVEANFLLGGNPVDHKRQQGIVSETIGESSMFFKSEPYLNLPICRATYDEIRRYVYLRVSIMRA